MKKGQLVAEIDPTVYDAALRQAEGELASAKADVTLKRQNLERKKILVPLKAASQLDLDQAVAELAQAEATVTIKQAALESAQANLGYCKITAPVDGIVISRKVDLGQTVIAAMSTPVLFTIAQDITKMNISAAVSEADIGQVKDGQPVDFTVDAFPDEVFHGKVDAGSQIAHHHAERRHLRDHHHRGQPGAKTVSRHDGGCFHPRGRAQQCPENSQRRPALHAAGWRDVSSKRRPRNWNATSGSFIPPGSDGTKLKPVIVKTGITDGVDTEILEGLDRGRAGRHRDASSDAHSSGFGGPPPASP